MARVINYTYVSNYSSIALSFILRNITLSPAKYTFKYVEKEIYLKLQYAFNLLLYLILLMLFNLKHFFRLTLTKLVFLIFLLNYYIFYFFITFTFILIIFYLIKINL